MSRTGIITSYLSLRLLVVRGFLDTYLNTPGVISVGSWLKVSRELNREHRSAFVLNIPVLGSY